MQRSNSGSNNPILNTSTNLTTITPHNFTPNDLTPVFIPVTTSTTLNPNSISTPSTDPMSSTIPLNMTSTLRRTAPPTAHEVIASLHRKYPSQLQRNKKIATMPPLKRLRMLLEYAGKEKELINKLRKEVLVYAKDNLNQVGTGESFTVSETNIGTSRDVAQARTGTKSDRAYAVNLLLEMLKTSSASEVYEYINTPNFQHMIGSDETQINIFRKHLTSIIREFISEYEAFKAISENDILIETLTDANVVETITPENLQLLFHYYNPKLIADLVLNFYPSTQFFKRFNKTPMDLNLFYLLLADDAETIANINLERSHICADLILPDGAVSPGRNTLRDERLNLYQLYQYEDETIYAVENWLQNEFSHLLVNKVSGDQFAKKPLHEAAPYYFYLISAAEYILLDPTKNSPMMWRYNKFRDDVRSLLASCDKKPVILCGIINIDGVHYLPYFIYKTPHDIVQVFTVDPSARMYPDHLVQEGMDDSKCKTHQKLKTIFLDIFPGCEFHDPDVAQMLRERDCGPNSATTLFDAFNTCLTSEPLLALNASGKLIFNTHKLSIQFQPIGINPYTQVYVYPSQLDEFSLTSRDQWKTRLSTLHSAYPLTRRKNNEDKPYSIHDEYVIEEQVYRDYSYIGAIENQQQNDQREISLSAIRSLLLSTQQGQQLTNSIISSYQNDLRLPSSLPLMRLIKTSFPPMELDTLTQSHHGNLADLADDFIVVLLKDHIPNAFMNAFRKLVLKDLAHNDQLDANAAVSDFLTVHTKIYSCLSIYQQREIRDLMLMEASQIIEKKLIDHHMGILKKYFNQECLGYLSSVPMNKKGRPDQIILQMMLSSHGELQSAAKYLLVHHDAGLLSFIHENTSRIVNEFNSSTLHYIQTHFDQWFPSLDHLTNFFSSDLQYIPRTAEMFKAYLPWDVNSYLGGMLLQNMNQCVYNLAVQRMRDSANISVQKFLTQDTVVQALMANQDMATLTEHVYRDGAVSLSPQVVPNFSALISTFGSPQTISNISFSHPLTSQYLYESLAQGVISLYQQTLHLQYNQFCTYLFSQHPTVFQYEQYMGVRHTNTDLLTYLISNSPAYPAFIIHFDQNPVERHFMEWFNQTVLSVINQHADNISLLMQKAVFVKSKLDELLAVYKNLHCDTKMLIQYQDRLINLIGAIRNIHLLNDFASHFDKLKLDLNAMTLESARFLISHDYSAGDLKPEEYTTLVRPIVCQLLGMKTPLVLTSDEAQKIDQAIVDTCQSTKPPILNLDLDTNAGLFNLIKQPTLPDTYDKPLTRPLALQCIAYWYTNHNWSYDLTHTDSWFNKHKEPAFIRFLINVINHHEFDDNGIINDRAAAKLKRLIHTNSNDPSLVFESTDIAVQIQATLLRTATIADTTKSSILYSDIAKLFNINLSSTQEPLPKPKPVVSAEAIQKKTMELVKKHKQENPTIPVNMFEISQQVKQLLGTDSNQSSAAQISFNQVESKTLARQPGLFSTSLFADRLTKAEKTLLRIKQKHSPKDDFVLDVDDIEMLRLVLANRWKDMVSQYGNESLAFECYATKPNRSDKVYIALAEILAAHYRKSNKLEFICSLLMPKCTCFGFLSSLRQITLAPSMAIELGVNVEESTIDNIKLSNLILTQSGYALNMHSIIESYKRTMTLDNPYTKQPFTREELSDICHHPNIDELKDQVLENITPRLTDRALDLLVDYLNEAIFTAGFTDNYDTSQNQKAFAAYTKFNTKVLNLPRSEREGLMQEPIPGGGGKTVSSVFAESEASSKHGGRLGGGNTCLTLRGVDLARVVIAYRGNNHGLTNSKLVSQALEKSIPRKTMQAAQADPLRAELGRAEQFILDFQPSRNARAQHKYPRL